MTETTSLSIDTVQTSTIQITNQSILGELRTYEKRYSDAISEFVWNAFDAEASCVDINYSFPEVANGSGFGYPDLEIIDDGTGWDMSDPSLVSTFLDSKKRAHKQSYKSIPHGRKVWVGLLSMLLPKRQNGKQISMVRLMIWLLKKRILVAIRLLL